MAFNKYQVIKGAVSYELANFIFNYFLLKRDAVKYMYDNNITYDSGMLGTWTDKQIPNTFSCYADNVMETLLVKMLPVMAKETGLDLRGETINEYGISFGVGLPIGRLFSNVNIGFELGSKGTTSQGLVKENFFNTFISLSLNDRWFEKRYID